MQERLNTISKIKNKEQRKNALVLLLHEATAAGLHGLIQKIAFILKKS